MTIWPRGDRPRRPRWTALFTSITLVWVVGESAVAELPQQALISDLHGNTSELLIRRSNRREPIQVGASRLNQFRDALLTVPPNNTRAWLRFLDANGQDLGFHVQTNTHPEPAIYYFPCQIQGGDQFIGWGLQRNEARGRGCEEGLQVLPGRGPGAAALEAIALKGEKPPTLAQGAARQMVYCSASDNNGHIGFATSASNPCQQAIEQCQAAGGTNCTPRMTGLWWTSEPEMTAILTCGNTSRETVTGSGSEIAALATGLLPKAQGANCRVQLLRPGDVVIVPATDAEVRAAGAEDILVRTRSTSDGVNVKVIRGAIRTDNPRQSQPQLVSQGQQVTISPSGSQMGTFDREAELTSVDMEVLCAFASNSSDRLSVPACKEELNIDTTAGVPVAFCNREQASGGQLGDRRFVQMSTNQGEIKLEYEMYEVPDRLEIRHEGRLIFDTGFISGRNTVLIPFQGQSGRLEVQVTGNPGIDTTQWNYLLECP